MEGKGMFLMAPGINTVSFYEGDLTGAKDYLRARLLQIWEANKWLGATIVQDKKKHGKLAALRWSTKEAPIDDMFSFVDDPASPLCGLSSSSKYVDVVKAVCGKDGANVPSGLNIIKSPTQPILRLTVAAGPPGKNAFTVVLSISHIACDGTSYYQVLNMLSSESEIMPLNVVRKQELHNQIPSLVGEKV
jgi:hypothetical protein